MQEISPRLAKVFAAIDAANAGDPEHITVDGRLEPAAVVDGRRMSETLERISIDVSELVQIAARGHHIERWTSPRQTYPAGRIGYLKWRKDLGVFHAQRLAALMQPLGYSSEEIERVGALVRKERLGSDPEVQLIEDASCLVFLAYGLRDFMAKTEEDKLARILAKTWRKMSENGLRHALALELPAHVPDLLERGLTALTRQPETS
ncbi:MAG: DUF4202 domain-containing protein [Rhodoplanes sp.]